MRGEDVEAWENIVQSGATELLKDIGMKMNNAMDQNFRYYDCSNIVNEITGEGKQFVDNGSST